MPNVNIYIPEKYVQPITERLKEGESLGVCAKRLLLNFLDGRDIDSNNQGAEIDSSDLEAIKERLSVLENEVGNGFIAYTELRDALDKFQLQIQGSYAIAEKCTELFKNQEARLNALEESKQLFSHATEIIEILKSQETRLDILKEATDHLEKDRLSHLEQAFGSGMERVVEMRGTLNDLIPRISEIENNLKQGRSRSKQPPRKANGQFIAKGDKDE